MLKHIGEFTDLAHCDVKLALKHLNHLVVILARRGLLHGVVSATTTSGGLLKLGEGLASLVDVIDGTDDLTNLLVVSVLALNLVFKVLFESLVLFLNFIDITGQCGHISLLVVELGRHVS